MQANKTWAQKLDDLKNLVQVQSSKGNYDYDEYMRGLANGLICALSVFTGEDPKYHDYKPAKILGRKGGIARAARLSPQRRKEIATNASHARKPKTK